MDGPFGSLQTTFRRSHRVNFFSNRAFAAFTVALAASIWALFTDVGRPYLPSVPIVIYTLYLYGNRTSVGRLGNDALKDSPYFLGFLLTMFALFKIFNDVSASASMFGQNPGLLTQEVGAAVLTTIVGLFSRQALLTLIRDEASEEDDRLIALANSVTSHAVAFEVARQQFFREMVQERERQTAEFKATQDRFLAQLDGLAHSRALVVERAAPAAARPPAETVPVAATPVANSPRSAAPTSPEPPRAMPYTGPAGDTPQSTPALPTPGQISAGSAPLQLPYLGQARAPGTPRREG